MSRAPLLKPELIEVMKGLMISIAVMACFLGACTYINGKLGLPPDHAIEEALEDHIEANTGIELDLTPDSPENG